MILWRWFAVAVVLLYSNSFVHAKWEVGRVTGMCDNQKPDNPANNVDPPCCEIEWTASYWHYFTDRYFYRYRAPVGFQCKYYAFQIVKSGKAGRWYHGKCRRGYRFDTKSCACQKKEKVFCRGCPVAKDRPYPICGERHWWVNDDVNSYFVRWGTGCKQYKHAALENLWVEEKWKTCPGNKVFNTKEIYCEDPQWTPRPNGGSTSCIDDAPPTELPLPKSNVPTALCMDLQDGLQPPCCETDEGRALDGSRNITHYAPVPGVDCIWYEKARLGYLDDAEEFKCPDGQRFSTDPDVCACQPANKVKCRYPFPPKDLQT